MRFVFALLVMASSAMAQNITAPTTWTKAMSPVTVASTLNLRSTLTIEAGVEVRMAPNSRVNFWTTSTPVLVINGTESEPVVFSCSSGTWAGFQMPSVTARRPVVRAENAIFDDLGSTALAVGLANGDVDFFNCRFSGVQAVTSGLAAGQPASVGGGYSMIGAFERCRFDGFSAGVVLSPGLALIDCDFANIPEPIRVAPGRSATISALGL